jgi:hypothetical protein
MQQWEQHRAMPDMPAGVLLKVIERASEVVAAAVSCRDRALTDSAD